MVAYVLATSARFNVASDTLIAESPESREDAYEQGTRIQLNRLHAAWTASIVAAVKVLISIVALAVSRPPAEDSVEASLAEGRSSASVVISGYVPGGSKVTLEVVAEDGSVTGRRLVVATDGRFSTDIPCSGPGQLLTVRATWIVGEATKTLTMPVRHLGPSPPGPSTPPAPV